MAKKTSPEVALGDRRVKIAINGFGRVGRQALKIALTKPELEVVAINDLTDNDMLAYLLKYDSVYRTYDKEVSADKEGLTVDGIKYPVFEEPEPDKLPWKKFDVDIVLECTGRFKTLEDMQPHLAAGAKKVILSTSPKDKTVPLFVYGANHEDLKNNDKAIIASGSCTTNCVTPLMKVLEDAFGVEKALLTTIHSYTISQSIVDDPAKDIRESRAAALNMIPSVTGAAKSVAMALPSFKGKFDGIAIRVPTPSGSIADVVAVLKKNVTVEKVNEAFKKAATTEGIMETVQYSEEELVLQDIIGTSHSTIIDGKMTLVIGGNLVKVVAWYDNEWAYCEQLVRLAIKFGQV